MQIPLEMGPCTYAPNKQFYWYVYALGLRDLDVLGKLYSVGCVSGKKAVRWIEMQGLLNCGFCACSLGAYVSSAGSTQSH